MVRRRRPLPASPRSLRARDRRARTAPRSAASRAPPLARGRAPRANPRALAVVRGAPGRTPRVRAIRPRVRARPPPGANEIRSIARSRGADPSLAPSRHTRGRGVTLGVHAPASRAIPRLSRSSPSTRNPDSLHPPSPHPRSSPLSLTSTNQLKSARRAQERRDVQRPPRELRHVDERAPQGGHLHEQGRRSVLAHGELLRPRKHDQVRLRPRRGHRPRAGGEPQATERQTRGRQGQRARRKRRRKGGVRRKRRRPRREGTRRGGARRPRREVLKATTDRRARASRRMRLAFFFFSKH